MQVDNNKYPFYPPYDDEIDFHEGTVVRVKRKSLR